MQLMQRAVVLKKKKKAELGAGYFLVPSLESFWGSIRRVGVAAGTSYRWSCPKDGCFSD